MKSLFSLAVLASLLLSACKKTEDYSFEFFEYNPTQPGFNIPNIPSDTTNHPDSSILVDASKDGGVWWFPQAGTFSSSQWHQGTALANLLRNQGFTVTELPRGATITWDLLRNYKNVIRATAIYPYAAAELAAYDSFLNRSSSLLLINDHLQYHANDALSAQLRLHFTGSVTGVINTLPVHEITTNVSTIPYIAGSVITQPDPARITVLGYAGNPSPTAPVAMGIVRHPSSKIFFIGDGNGLQQLPQPFTNNLIKWMFH